MCDVKMTTNKIALFFFFFRNTHLVYSGKIKRLDIDYTKINIFAPNINNHFCRYATELTRLYVQYNSTGVGTVRQRWKSWSRVANVICTKGTRHGRPFGDQLKWQTVPGRRHGDPESSSELVNRPLSSLTTSNVPCPST